MWQALDYHAREEFRSSHNRVLRSTSVCMAFLVISLTEAFILSVLRRCDLKTANREKYRMCAFNP